MSTPDYKIMVGDNRVSLRELAENSVDAIVTDPPYGLEFMGKDWDAPWKAMPSKEFNEIEKGTLGGFTKLPNHSRVNNVKCEKCEKWKFSSNPCTCESPSFPPARQEAMQAFQDWCKLWAVEAYRVLKPGGHLLAFSGSRTYHRMACAIEDAGFEVRDQMMWVYGSGFPKSHNIAKKIEGWDGWGTALKPAHEPIVLARKPLEGTVADNVMKWGTGAINIAGCRVGNDAVPLFSHRGEPNQIYSDGLGGSNRTGEKTTQGRWPANLMHDGSEEVLELFPETKSGELKGYKSGGGSNGHLAGKDARTYTDSTASSGSAARFFYCPKASKRDRDEGCDNLEAKPFKTNQPYGDGPEARAEGNARGSRNFHPTVKPTELMAYLCRLITPPGGLILDPFMGSGSTGKAAIREGFRFVGMELSQEYADIAAARIAHEAAKRS